MKKVFFLLPLIACLASCGQQSEEASNGDDQAIRENVASYVASINNRDLDGIANHWDADAVWRNPFTGELVQGRPGIKREFIEIFDALGNAEVDIHIHAIDYPLDGKAVERGVASLVVPGETPVESDFRMIHIKKNGKWMIQHVSDIDMGSIEDN